jgi:hypothetical protein
VLDLDQGSALSALPRLPGNGPASGPRDLGVATLLGNNEARLREASVNVDASCNICPASLGLESQPIVANAIEQRINLSPRPTRPWSLYGNRRKMRLWQWARDAPSRSDDDRLEVEGSAPIDVLIARDLALR